MPENAPRFRLKDHLWLIFFLFLPLVILSMDLPGTFLYNVLGRPREGGGPSRNGSPEDRSRAISNPGASRAAGARNRSR